MNVLVDTSVWSLSLRRRRRDLSRPQKALVFELEELIREGRVVLPGPVRYELLSGIREESVFERLRDRLRAFEDEPCAVEDYETAAKLGNRCRSAGRVVAAIDVLLCAYADRRGLAVFTRDDDFLALAPHVPLRLHTPRSGGLTRRVDA